MPRRIVLTLAVAALGWVPAVAQDAPADFASRAQLGARIAEMERRLGDATFAYEPVLAADGTVAALEYWKAPGRPAVHPDEAEYALVIEGAGTLISGGTMADAQETRPGLIEGSRIDGGTTRQLRPGDVILVPAGVPHWFGIDGRLVLLGMKLAKR